MQYDQKEAYVKTSTAPPVRAATIADELNSLEEQIGSLVDLEMRLGSVAQSLGGSWPENPEPAKDAVSIQSNVLDKLSFYNRLLRQVRGKIGDHLNYIQSKIG